MTLLSFTIVIQKILRSIQSFCNLYSIIKKILIFHIPYEEGVKDVLFI